MIKSPCRDCEVYEQDFPTCSENCALLKNVQRLDNMHPPDVKDSLKYVPSEGHSFANKTKHHRAMS